MATAIDLLVHPSIMMGVKLRQLEAHMVNVYSKLDTCVTMEKLLESVEAKIKEFDSNTHVFSTALLTISPSQYGKSLQILG